PTPTPDPFPSTPLFRSIVLMALGLGIGAMYVRSLTVYLVRQGTLDDYVYLEHGAHYAIGALALILLITIQYEIHEIITGLIGVRSEEHTSELQSRENLV